MNTYILKIKDEQGIWVNIPAIKGDNGDDGYSPSAKVTQEDDITTITITDKDGTTSKNIDLTGYQPSGDYATNTALTQGLSTKQNITDNTLTTTDKTIVGAINEVNVITAGKADTATTLSGYGITDAYTKTEVDTALNNKADIDASNISSTGKETIVGWGMPDYENVIEGTMPSLGSWVQCVKDSFVCCYGSDAYVEDYWCYVSPDNGTTTYVVGRRFDDINSNTHHTSFTFLVPKGWYFICTAEIAPHYYIYPLKGVN